MENMDSKAIRTEIDKYSKYTNEELLLSLVDGQGDGIDVVYAPGGRKARARELFKSYLLETKHVICSSYNSHNNEYSSIYEGLILLLPSVLDLIPIKVVIPFLLLVLKYGLNRLCSYEK